MQQRFFASLVRSLANITTSFGSGPVVSVNDVTEPPISTRLLLLSESATQAIQHEAIHTRDTVVHLS